MKNLVAVAAVLALAFAGQCFAEDLDSSHDCKEHGGQMVNGHCMKDGVEIGTGAGVVSPAVAGGEAAGGLSAGAVAGIVAVVAVAVAVGVSGNGNKDEHGTSGTTGTH